MDGSHAAAAPLPAAGIDALRAEVEQAYDALVAALLDLKNGTVDALETRVVGLEQLRQPLIDTRVRVDQALRQFDLERTLRSLAETSRAHAKERCVVFVGRDYFGDNLKYAWLAAQEQAAQHAFECWYLPFDRAQEDVVRALGANCFPADHAAWTSHDVSRALGAGVAVLCDTFFSAGHPNPYAPALLSGARKVQLWHGISIKEIALRNLRPLHATTPFFAELQAACCGYAAFLGASRAAEGEWRRWFAFDGYAAIGYPRNDVLCRAPTARDLIGVDTSALQRARATRTAGGQVLIYTPTFRDGNRGRWILDAGVDGLASALAARGDLLLVNLHPYEHDFAGPLAQACPDACVIAPHSDIYPLLRETTALVTDYSSLMFDYLLLDRPLYFFRPDHATYVAASRALFDGKLACLPGPLAESVDALLALTKDARGDEPDCVAERHALRARLFDRIDDGASARTLDLIVAELAMATAPATAARGYP